VYFGFMKEDFAFTKQYSGFANEYF
jgi:hypothetical protein